MKKNNKKNKKVNQSAVIAGEVMIAGTAVHTASRTDVYNKECSELRGELDSIRQENQGNLNGKLEQDPTFVGDRSKAVETAYRYEAADVKMGGRGSANWTESQREELLQTGRVRGCEGHHINSVAEHPEEQTNPDNVRFYYGRKEHLEQGHGGNFRNPSSGKMVDRDAMLRQTNTKRVVENEVAGAGAAVAAGAAIGLVSSISESCKKNGVSFRSVVHGVKHSGKKVASSSLIAIVTYGTARVLTEIFK